MLIELFELVSYYNLQVFYFFINIPYPAEYNTFWCFLSFVLCFSALSVPLYSIITRKTICKRDIKVFKELEFLNFRRERQKEIMRNKAVFVLLILIVLFFSLRFFEKGVLDNVLSFNTVPFWREIVGVNWLTSMELHEPFPSCPSGHILKCLFIWGVCYYFYRNDWVKWSAIGCVGLMFFIRLYQGMHTPLDMIITIPVAILLYKAFNKLYSAFWDWKSKKYKKGNKNEDIR